jgi:hypothetical protein
VPDANDLTEVVTDMREHSNQVMVDLEAGGTPHLLAEPERGQQRWTEHPGPRAASVATGAAFVRSVLPTPTPAEGANDWNGRLHLSIEGPTCGWSEPGDSANILERAIVHVSA